MSKVHITEQEFRFYDMPKEDPVLVFSGESWRKNYGDGSKKLHFHNILEIGICLEGEGWMLYEGEQRRYRKGDISVIPRHVPHTTYNEPGEYTTWSYIFIDETAYLQRFFSGDPSFARGMEEHINSRFLLLRREAHPGLTASIETIVREQMWGHAYAREVINAQVVSLLMHVARENRDYDKGLDLERREQGRKIQNALAYIEHHYDRQLTIGDVARAASLSEPHFRRVFSAIMNMTPGDYLNMIRIQHACTLLKNTDLSVELVAERSGFVTPSTFNRNFRSYLGMTPLQWKKTKAGSREGDGGIRVSAYRGWEK